MNNIKTRYSPVFRTLKYLESESSCREFIRAISLFESLQPQFSLIFHATNLPCVIAQDVNSLITSSVSTIWIKPPSPRVNRLLHTTRKSTPLARLSQTSVARALFVRASLVQTIRVIVNDLVSARHYAQWSAQVPS